MAKNFFSSTLQLFPKEKPAIITTDIVPSPTSLSTVLAASINTFAAGCSTSIFRKKVAPSLVNVDSPIISIYIFSLPVGPKHFRLNL